MLILHKFVEDPNLHKVGRDNLSGQIWWDCDLIEQLCLFYVFDIVYFFWFIR